MATYVPAKRATEYILYVGLVSQANTKLLQTNPTIAAGDFKVSKDGGALANLNTLPAVTPASSKMVKITLSSTEMTADNVTVVCSDAAGAEWCDLLINIQTAARQIDDLTFPNTSGRGMDVDASGGVEVGTFQAGAITAAAIATDAIDADALADGAITAATFAAGAIDATAIATDAIGANEFSQAAADKVWSTASRTLTAFGFSVTITAASVQAIWDALTSALTTANSIGKLLVDNINATVSSRATQTSVDTIDDFLDTEIAAIKAKTDQLTFTAANKVDATLNAAGDVAAAVANKLADHTLRRTFANARASANGDAVSLRSLLGGLAKLVNKWTISGATLTIYAEDDLTSLGTQTVTTTGGANPITQIDTD